MNGVVNSLTETFKSHRQNRNTRPIKRTNNDKVLSSEEGDFRSTGQCIKSTRLAIGKEVVNEIRQQLTKSLKCPQIFDIEHEGCMITSTFRAFSPGLHKKYPYNQISRLQTPQSVVLFNDP